MPLSIQLTPEAASDFRKYILKRGWSDSEGVQILLSVGIGFMAGKYILRAVQIGEEYREAELLSFKNRLMEAEAEVASLRYRLFEMRESNKNWSHTAAALERENQALKSLAEQLRAENEQLRAPGLDLPELLEGENKYFAACERAQANEKPAAWWGWLKQFFRW